jgi:hypothetical protein
MRPIKILALLGILILSPIANQSQAEVSFGLSIDNDGLKGFYLAIGEHYQVPEKQIVVVREKNIPDEEMPVVFFLARKSGVTPDVIIKLRLSGNTWMDITTHYGLTAEVFYVPVTVDPGPPYGKAYGHFKKHKKSQWGSIRLSDVEVINFVNLKFISDYYQCPADDVIGMRQKGTNFVDINAAVKKNKQQKKQQKAKRADQEPKKKKGKGKKH